MAVEKKPSERIKVAPLIVAVQEPLRIKAVLAHPSKYSRQRREHVSFIVLHATHGAEGPNKDNDEAVASSKPLLPGELPHSAHYFVDSDSATRSVPDLLTAYHAGKHANAAGIGVEICGRADQSLKQWLDKVSLPTLQIAARLVADLCKEHKIPAEFLDVDGLLAGSKGITTHALVAEAWKETKHWDPGPDFPLQAFIAAVKNALPQLPEA